MTHMMEYFATCPKGLEGLLMAEIHHLGAEQTRETVAGVYFSATLSVAYRICLWSRLANKVLLPLARFDVREADDLYEGANAIDWQEHISPNHRFLVEFSGSSSQIRNTQFGALKIKDAIVDKVRDYCGERPSVSKQNPDIRINARLSKGKAVVSLDLSGESLHRRGYRLKQGAAPLKENLAAALLIRSGWPELAAQGGALLDPMCGSGTLLIEGAMMAADVAPGLLRSDFGFERWLNHRNDVWLEIREEAFSRRQQGLDNLTLEIRGYDADVRVLRAAESNIENAGLDQSVRVIHKSLDALKKPTHRVLESGLVISNPPYGERLGDVENLKGLYKSLGKCLKHEFKGWQAGIFTGNPDLGKHMGLRARKKYKLFNGALPSELLLFSVTDESFVDQPGPGHFIAKLAQAEPSAGTQMVINRLRKNQKALAKWKKNNQIEAYRLYDADMPEYAAAVDVYGDCVHVQEYAAPKSIDENKASHRFNELLAAIPQVLPVKPEDISIKQRRRNRGTAQYEKIVDAEQRGNLIVTEGTARFAVDLWRYLDTGLFLDHRPVRKMIGELFETETQQKAQNPWADSRAHHRFLNLFCYTATATVHAALAGARYSVSVDMSRTYLAWAKENFALNRISENHHHLVQADCFQWLTDCREAFDVIMLDPPSFSNSKRMQGVLDIQRDHVKLIRRCMELLNPNGVLIFSNNLRNFKLDPVLSEQYKTDNVSAKSIDKDFERNQKIHQCWLIRHL